MSLIVGPPWGRSAREGRVGSGQRKAEPFGGRRIALRQYYALFGGLRHGQQQPASSDLTFSFGYMALEAALAGHGVVLAYSTIAAADLAAGRLVRLFSLALPDLFAYYIVTAPGALDRPKIRAFRTWLRQEADA